MAETPPLLPAGTSISLAGFSLLRHFSTRPYPLASGFVTSSCYSVDTSQGKGLCRPYSPAYLSHTLYRALAPLVEGRAPMIA